ncbi:hypothetical protein LMG28727_07466 [Paraburkholderia kirstenboschensis]|uniref:DUF4148 domain-containing protein n=1 Tax=Paraburkholderia kirstenboschensis TaxID=1245436 RepID=UPI000A8C29B9|nr:DUF4148 domain-containing protein [Paraburkholderia kirstenboschensis]CAD6561534.1 hypothetical protein LMG28727_07466 [Paraburkholderia kirstenboschensis]
MKKTTHVAIGALACSIAMSAVAQTQPTGKTRADVRAELIEAQRDGLVPTPKYDYPPSEAAIERNKALYAITHNGEKLSPVSAAPTQSPSETVQ